MQFRRVPHAVTPTGPRGNAGAGNDNSDAESSQCPSDADPQCPSERSCNENSDAASSFYPCDADPVTPNKRRRNEFELDNDKDVSEEWSPEETAVMEDPPPKRKRTRVLAQYEKVVQWVIGERAVMSKDEVEAALKSAALAQMHLSGTTKFVKGQAKGVRFRRVEGIW